MTFQEMYVIIFGVVILTLQISVSDPQFPLHIDFLKVGEVIFNNEKFKILKTTTHLVTDHFKDFMLKQGSAHPGERVFIDKNGLRHTWSGFGEKTKSLRKTDLKSKLKHISGSFENVSEKAPESGIISTDGNNNDNTTAAVDDSNENENNNQEKENNGGNNGTDQNLTEHTQNATRTHEMNSTEITIETRISDKKKTVKKKDKKNKKVKVATKNNKTSKTKKPATAEVKKPTIPKDNVNKLTAAPKDNTNLKLLKSNENKPIGKERTVATTTFFCPFFGVITMSAFID